MWATRPHQLELAVLTFEVTKIKPQLEAKQRAKEHAQTAQHEEIGNEKCQVKEAASVAVRKGE
jgi:hypothetical protein